MEDYFPVDFDKQSLLLFTSFLEKGDINAEEKEELDRKIA